jgi:energy-coupling factor transporter ATP-binding protein EcfA2
VSLDRGDGTYAGWTVFAGRNGAGKSTLLKALALSVIGPLASRSLAGVFNDWVCRGAENAVLRTRLLRDATHDVYRTGRPNEKPFWVGLTWRATEHGTDVLDRWADKKVEGTRSGDNGPWADAPTGWFIAGYGPYRHLGAPPTEVVKLSADPVMARLINLFNESATLSDAVDWLKGIHLRALEARPGAAQLRDTVIRVLNDGLLPDGSAVDAVDSDGLWIVRDGVRMPLEQVSDGYRTVTALVVDLLRRLNDAFGNLELSPEETGTVCRLPGVVLIDEVDAHMHVAWQQNIGPWLTKHFPAIQFLVTTHSPFICQAASPKGLIRLPAPGEQRKLEHVPEELFRAVVNGTGDDAVLTDLFGLDHAHSARAERLRKEAAELELKVLRDSASPDELARYEELNKVLPTDLGSLAERRLRELGIPR